MFILTAISDVIDIEPSDFRKKSATALQDNINQKYANKVIQKIGLCVCFYDLLWASEGLIGHGDGIVHVNAHFRLIVFRPFKGEVLEGTISECTADGIKIEMEFFSDINIPKSALPKPRLFFIPPPNSPPSDHPVWKWKYVEADKFDEGSICPSEPSSPGVETDNMFYDRGERVRFRVEDELWVDQPPVIEDPAAVAERRRQQMEKQLKEGAGTNGDTAQSNVNGVTQSGGMIARKDGEGVRSSPWRIVGSMAQDGLGVKHWWEDSPGVTADDKSTSRGTTAQPADSETVTE